MMIKLQLRLKSALLLAAIGLMPQIALAEAQQATPANHTARLLRLLPAQTAAVIGFEAAPQGDQQLLERFRAEILFAAGLKEKLGDLRPLLDALAPSQSILLATIARPDGGDGWVALIAGPQQSRWLQALQEAGWSDALQADGAVWMTPASQSNGDSSSLLVVRQPELLLMGEPATVKLCLEQQKSNQEGFAAEPAVGQRAAELSAQAQVWGVARKQWLQGDLSSREVAGMPEAFLLKSLSGVRLLDFSARIGSQVDFRMRTQAANQSQARILADELAEFVSWAAPPDAPHEVRQVMQGARVDRLGCTIELSMQITPEAMERIRDNQASQAILRWRLDAAVREGRQRVGELFRWMEVRSGSRVADIGAGSGFMTIRLARLVGPQGLAYAVEIQPNLVERVQQRSERNELPQLQAVLGEADNPNLPAGELDSVLIVNSYHEMEHYQDMLLHIRRSLRPGGRLVITEPYSPSSSGDSRASQVEKHKIAPHLAQQELEQAGFEILHRQDDFIDRGHDEHDHREWLIVAVKSEGRQD
ncbi:MAG: methyltransferase domain-containing protein [Acidobacteriota bacterium]